MQTEQFKHLFSPIDVGPATLKNRIFVTPHAMGFASDSRDNLPGETLAFYCAERAKGGAALVEVSMAVASVSNLSELKPYTDSQFDPRCGAHPASLSGRWPIRGTDPRIVDGYSKLARAVHQYGSKCFMELSGSGSQHISDMGVSKYPGPSVTPIGVYLPFTAREMDEISIEKMVESFGLCAKYVREAGLDGIDLHATQGSILNEFLSGAMNQRTDRYGGSIENRTRFLFEVIDRVREYTRGELAIEVRLIGNENLEKGITPQESAEIAKMLDGRVDCITPDRGLMPNDEDWQTVPMYIESGYNLGLSSPIKAVLRKTKLGVVGRYVDPYYAERLIAEGLADLVALTRALIADPELPNKAMQGRIEDIRPCIGVLQDCWGRMLKGLPMSCTVNPVVGREKQWGIGSIQKAEQTKKILIIGGGIAGLETARVAAERGHQVVIYEKSSNLGGQALLAAKLPGRADIKAIVNWELGQIKQHGVEIKLGLELTPDPETVRFVLDEEKPDAVVIATGSTAIRNGFQPYTFNEIPGWNQPNVCTDIDALSGSIDFGTNILIADSLSFIEAPGIAELLAKQGKNVEIITFHTYVGLELRLINHWSHVIPRLIQSDVKITPFTWIRRIEGHFVSVYNVFDEKRQRVINDIDNLILITGKVQNDGLFAAFKEKIDNVFLVGDANIGGARIGSAMYDGQKVGREL